MTVQRWTGAVRAHDAGGFVAVGDYLQLQAENAELRAKSDMDDAMLAGNGALITGLRAKLAELEAVQTRLDSLIDANEKLQAHLHKKRAELERPRFNLDRCSDRPDAPNSAALQALQALKARLILIETACFSIGPKQAVGEMIEAMRKMNEWEVIRAELAKPEPEPAIWRSWNDAYGYGYWDTYDEADMHCAHDTDPEPLYLGAKP